MDHKYNDNKLPKGQKERLGRRDFLKVGAVGAAVGITSVMAMKPSLLAADGSSRAATMEVDGIPNRISENYQQFDHKNTVYSRGLWDPPMIQLNMKFLNKFLFAPPISNESGYTRLDRALYDAGWAFMFKYSMWSGIGQPDTDAYPWNNQINPTKHEFISPEDASKKVKKAAKFLGASLVGITKYDPRWTYSSIFKVVKFGDAGPQMPLPFPLEMKNIKTEFPFEPKSVVVMALAMDYKALACSPAYPSGAAVGRAYGQMVPVGVSVTRFLTGLGYRSFANGNDSTLSIPYGVAAGLGELGRHGILITKEFGSRVRLVKVLTELELKPDKPKVFGAANFCKTCKRCAESCPGKAISFGELTFEGPTISNNPRVEKWYLNPEKCFNFWAEHQGTDCSNCIASCPYTKTDMWNHRLIADLTAVPGTPLHYTMAKMDKIFGYGKTFDKKSCARWWEED